MINFLKGLVLGSSLPIMFYLLNNNHRLAYLIMIPVYGLIVLAMFHKQMK